MMFSKKEKEVMKSIVEYHLKEVRKDKKLLNPEVVALLGAEAKYEHILEQLLKKLQ